MNTPTVTTLIENKTETKNIKTMLFEYPKKIKPGQFFMIWIPGIDEIPMSVSYIKNDIKGITYRKIGEATSAMYNLKKGEKIGIRGPYGNYFKIKGKNILFVGGGTGVGMLTPAIEQSIAKKIKTTAIIGFKTKKEIFFEKKLKNSDAKIYITTDDGSEGYKGVASDLAKDLIGKNKFTSVLTCGPELMMKRLYGECKNIPFQASLERYIKCGIGLCGQCCIGDGIRICKEGPILDGKTLKNVKDFGKYKRDSAGRKVKF